MTLTVNVVDEFVPHPVKEQLPGVDYCVNSNPSWGEAVILGFQHYLVMLGMTVIIPTIIVPYMGGGHVEKAQVIQTLLFVSGVNTLLQTWFGTRLPVVIGGSFRFMIPSLCVAFAQRFYSYLYPKERFLQTMRATQGALMIASALPMLLGFLGIWRIVVRFLSPLSAVPLVALVGLGLYEQSFPLLAECVEIGLPELVILISLSHIMEWFYKRMSYSVETSSSSVKAPTVPTDFQGPLEFPQESQPQTCCTFPSALCLDCKHDYRLHLRIAHTRMEMSTSTQSINTTTLRSDTLREQDFKPYMWSFKRPIFDRFAVLLSVGIVWAYAALLTVAGAYTNKPLKTQFSCRVDRSGLVSGSSWISFPYPLQWGKPSLKVEEVLLMLAATFVAMVESTGAFIAASRYGSATHIPSSVLSRGIGWLGFGMFLDGLFGTGTGSTVSVENVGLLALTRVGSRRVVQISAVFMLFFSVLGKFGAVVASIPLPIVGALYCVLFALMSSAGLGLLQYCNLNSFRTKFIIGFSLFMGLSVPRYFSDYAITSGHAPLHTHSLWFNKMVLVIFTSPALVGGIVAIFLDLTLARKHANTRRDSGRHGWAKFKYFDKDPRSEEFYSLPYGLSKYFPSL